MCKWEAYLMKINAQVDAGLMKNYLESGSVIDEKKS